MLEPAFTKKFIKDYKLAIKRETQTKEIDEVLTLLVKQEPLVFKHKDHALIGNYTNLRERHIKNDSLLIYSYESGRMIFKILGTHSDLFDK